MTTTSQTRPAARAHGQSSAHGFMGRLRVFLSRSRAERQLAQLDDRLLADIGLKRSEIRKMVWGN